MDTAILETVQRYTETHPRIASNLEPTDMGKVAQDVAASDARIRVDIAGDLIGMWDRGAVREVLAAVVDEIADHSAAAVAVSLREAGDHQSIVVATTRDGPGSTRHALSDRIRELALTHGARFLIHSDDELTIEWPRTPLVEAPDRT